MSPVEFADPGVRHIELTIERLERSLLGAAVAASDPRAFAEVAAALLFKSLPVEGVGVWITTSAEQDAEPVAFFGNGRDLERCPASLQEAAGRPRPDDTVRGLPEAGVSRASFSVPDIGQVTFLVSIPHEEVWSLFSEGWLEKAIAPAIQILAAHIEARESSAVSSLLVRESVDSLIGLNEAGECTLWSPAAEALFGWPEPDVIHVPLRIVPRSHAATWEQSVNAARASGRPLTVRLTGQRWDGTLVPVEARIVPLLGDIRSLPHVLLVLRDMTLAAETGEWRKLVASASQALHAATGEIPSIGNCLAPLISSGRFRRAALWHMSADGQGWTLHTSEPAAARTAGGLPDNLIAKAVAGKLVDLVGPVEMPVPSQGRVLRRPTGSLVGVPLPDRQSLLVLEQAGYEEPGEAAREALRTIASIVGSALDRERLTRELEQMRERVTQAAKLESLGLLATTVAHDLNNILTVVFGYADLARHSNSPQDSIGEIEKAAEKAAALSRQLLRSGRTTRNETVVFDVATAVAELEPLIRSLTGSKITLKIDAAVRGLCVRMPRTDFDQLVLNLVANARDAMPAGGLLGIRLAAVEPVLRDLERNPRLRSGSCVQLRVIDNGAGMTAEVCSRMFDSFFTTKEAGKGTGVGLATVRQVVDRAAGGISVESRPSVGTAMTVLLPRVMSAVCPRTVDARPEVLPSGTESVLIVEEEPRLRDLLARILELRGYKVRSLAQLPVEPLPELAGAELVIADRSTIEAAPQKCPRKGTDRCAALALVEADCDSAMPATAFAVCRMLPRPFTSHQVAIAVREALDAR
ncbi:Blue-light-activated protein [Caulifigura coniformis]|uniref:histidine kinase n=1 Tax=Caulifigura coniformis TaxID=2527983 RepID=A0A517SMW4_9PLAN|nr:ATP-binding protein [Caulifigura coniformis]QDT57462.1 Blue-light-activated protein [Caulifigura coniformis]